MIETGLTWRRALGEVLIVVVGVLLALAANRWNESRIERATASASVARLRAGLASDTGEDRRAAADAMVIDSAAFYVLGVARGSAVPPNEYGRFVRMVLVASWAPRPRSSRPLFGELVATGKLALLPARLRTAIAYYYALVDAYDDREATFIEQLQRGYWTVPSRVLGPEVLPQAWQVLSSHPDPISYDPSPEELSLTRAKIAAMIERLRGLPELEADIAQVRHFEVQRRSIYGKRLIAAADSLQNALGRP